MEMQTEDRKATKDIKEANWLDYWFGCVCADCDDLTNIELYELFEEVI